METQVVFCVEPRVETQAESYVEPKQNYPWGRNTRRFSRDELPRQIKPFRKLFIEYGLFISLAAMTV